MSCTSRLGLLTQLRTPVQRSPNIFLKTKLSPKTELVQEML